MPSKFSDSIRAIIDKVLPERNDLRCQRSAVRRILDIVVPDYNRVNIVSPAVVALVIAITYKALILPIVVAHPD